MKIRAKLLKKFPLQTFGDQGNEFKKITCLFEEVEPEIENPNTLAIDFSNKNLALVEAIQYGKIYDICYSTTAKETEKAGVFNTIRGWKIKEVWEIKEENDETLPF